MTENPNGKPGQTQTSGQRFWWPVKTLRYWLLLALGLTMLIFIVRIVCDRGFVGRVPSLANLQSNILIGAFLGIALDVIALLLVIDGIRWVVKKIMKKVDELS